MSPAQPSEHDVQVERLEQQMSMLLRRSRSFLRTFASRVHPGVDGNAYAVLLAIAQGGPLRLMDLAEEFGLDKSTMSRQVSGLAELGLIERRPDPADGRAFLLELSADGRQRLASAVSARRAVWHERLDSWSTGDIAALADGLARLAAELPDPD